MLNQNNLDKFYELAINKQEILTMELKDIGFNPIDINNLLSKGILRRIKRGIYKFIGFDELYEYGMSLVDEDMTKACFERCYQLNPNHRELNLQLFYNSILARNYQEALIYLDNFFDKDNPNDNFLLYLLSFAVELPEKYNEYARNLTYNNLKIDINLDEDKKRSIILPVLNQKFNSPLYIMSSSLPNEDKSVTFNAAVMSLLTKCDVTSKNEKQILVDLASNKKYEKIISFLETINKKHDLAKHYKYALLIAKDLDNLVKTGQFPIKQPGEVRTFTEAINTKNYEFALEFNRQKPKTIAHKPCHIILLEDIVTRIKKKTNSSKIEVNVSNPKTEEVVVKHFDFKNSLNDIISSLLKNDIDTAFKILKNYLEFFNKKEYEFLIVDLIKISLIENDLSFAKPMAELLQISKNSFQFNISLYVQEFYASLMNNKFKEAWIYLDIIKNASTLKETNISVDLLESMLVEAQKSVNINENDSFVNFKEKVDDEKISSNKLVGDGRDLTKLQEEKNYSANILEKYKLPTIDELRLRGIVLLKIMDYEKIENVIDALKDMPNVAYFTINSGNRITLVLRYVDNEFVNIKEMLSNGNNAHHNGDYNEAIKCFRKILQVNNPKPFIYSQLGVAYLKNNDIKTAIDYLTIADELTDRGYTNLLARLKGDLIEKEEAKPFVKVNIGDFNDTNNFFQIEKFFEIEKLLENGISLEDACNSMGLSEENFPLVALLVARECYMKEEYKIGDSYLKYAEKFKNKSDVVKDLLNEVRLNKMFYKNRVNDDRPLFKLSLKR